MTKYYVLFAMLYLNIHVHGQDLSCKVHEQNIGDSVSFTVYNNSDSDLFFTVAAETKAGNKIVKVTKDIFSGFEAEIQTVNRIKPGESDTLIWNPGLIKFINPRTLDYEPATKGQFRLFILYDASVTQRDKDIKSSFFDWKNK